MIARTTIPERRGVSPPVRSQLLALRSGGLRPPLAGAKYLFKTTDIPVNQTIGSPWKVTDEKETESTSVAYPPGHSLSHCLDHLLTKPMVLFSLIFLAALAGLLHRHVNGELTRIETQILFWTLCILWPIFIAEAILRFFMRAKQVGFWSRTGFLLLNVLLPPVRLSAKSYLDIKLIWLPFIGWNHVDKYLRRRLEKAFSIPMIIIALMVLPFLAMEYFWESAIEQNFTLELVLDVGTSIIWAAFALELTIMLSVARRKFQYCARNWIDVAVVMLPLLDFLPMLRLLRLSRVISLQKMSRLGRLYRLRGLLMRAWRAVLVLEVLQRLFNSTPEKRLRQIRELIAAKEEELEELRQEADELTKQINSQEEVAVED